MSRPFRFTFILFLAGTAVTYAAEAAGNPAEALRAFEELRILLRAMRDAGYDLGDGFPEDGDTLIHALIAAGGHDTEWLTEDQLRAAPARVPLAGVAVTYAQIAMKPARKDPTRFTASVAHQANRRPRRSPPASTTASTNGSGRNPSASVTSGNCAVLSLPFRDQSRTRGWPVAGSSETSGQFGSASPLDARNASRSAVVIAWPVRSPTWSRRSRLAPPQRARR